jgi:hypothetical protein
MHGSCAMRAPEMGRRLRISSFRHG